MNFITESPEKYNMPKNGGMNNNAEETSGCKIIGKRYEKDNKIGIINTLISLISFIDHKDK
jgi:hypothetical protein